MCACDLMGANIGTPEMIREEPRCKAGKPFIEVTEQYARSLEVASLEDV